MTDIPTQRFFLRHKGPGVVASAQSPVTYTAIGVLAQMRASTMHTVAIDVATGRELEFDDIKEMVIPQQDEDA